MLHEKDFEQEDPKNKDYEASYSDSETANEENDDEGFDILPSNGPGLAGDDGEQIIDSDEEEEENSDDE